jgi:peptidoglycan-associated lipoprotein
MKKLIVTMIVVSFLGACSNKAVKEEPKVAPPPAPVATQTPTPKAPAPMPAQPAPVVERKMEVNPLTDPNNILSKRSVYFDYDKYDVNAEYRPLIEAHAKYLLEHPQTNITLQGNADERGSREYNLALGQKRAVAVKQVLNVLGVPDKQIETISFGKEKPKALGHDEASWSQNRRADIVYQGEK